MSGKVEYAIARALVDVAKAKRNLAVAQRALILIRALKETGQATLMWGNGERLTWTASDRDFRPGLGEQQAQWNIYYTLRDCASMSIKAVPEQTP